MSIRLGQSLRQFEMCLGLALGALFLLPPLNSPALSANCPKSIEPIQDQRLGYQDRKDRCEGLLVQPVAASAGIKIIGFHRHIPEYVVPNPDKYVVPEKPILVSVAAASSSQALFVRAISVRHQLYYRMDTTVQSGEVFPWDRKIISDRKILLHPQELMIVACEGPCDKPEPHIFPVSITEDGRQPESRPAIVFSTALDVSHLNLTLTRVSDGKIVRNIDNLDILDGQILPAGKPKFYPLDDIKPAGLYRLKVRAIPRYGANAMDEARAVLAIP